MMCSDKIGSFDLIVMSFQFSVRPNEAMRRFYFHTQKNRFRNSFYKSIIGYANSATTTLPNSPNHQSIFFTISEDEIEAELFPLKVRFL